MCGVSGTHRLALTLPLDGYDELDEFVARFMNHARPEGDKRAMPTTGGHGRFKIM